MFYHLVNLWALRLLFARHFVLVGHKTDVVPFFWPYIFVSGSSASLFRAFAETLGCTIRARESVLVGVWEYTTRRNLSITFWEGKELVTKTIGYSGRDVPVVKSNVFLSSQLLSAVSTKPRKIGCGDSSLEFMKALDKAPSQKTGIQYPFSLSPMHIEKLTQSTQYFRKVC